MAWASPCILLFDFASAFPSISRQYIRAALAAMRLPRGSQDAVNGLYSTSRTSIGRPTSGHHEAFDVSSGVPQGCPLSGSVFAPALRPLLEQLVQVCGSDMVFMYADDIGVVVRSLHMLGPLHQLFQAFARASGLELKPGKCLLIPLRLHDAPEHEVLRRYATGLKCVAPGWKDMRVALQGEYLGFVIGPGATMSERWRKAASKYEGRCKDFSRGGLAPSAGLRYHEAFAKPVLSYVAQVTPDEGEVQKMQDLAMQRLLHLPWRALPRGAAPLLHQAGCRVFVTCLRCARPRGSELRTAMQVMWRLVRRALRQRALSCDRSRPWWTHRRSETTLFGTAQLSRTPWGPICCALGSFSDQIFRAPPSPARIRRTFTVG